MCIAFEEFFLFIIAHIPVIFTSCFFISQPISVNTEFSCGEIELTKNLGCSNSRSKSLECQPNKFDLLMPDRSFFCKDLIYLNIFSFMSLFFGIVEVHAIEVPVAMSPLAAGRDVVAHLLENGW